MEYFLIISPNFTRSHGSIRWISWEKPIPNGYKLNANDSSLRNPGKARGGGIIRDHICNRVGGCARAIESSSISVAELWAVGDGLTLCNQLHIDFLIVELTPMIINMLNDANSFSRSLSPLVDDCRVLLSRIPHHKVQHCFREANKCADDMAKMGADLAMDYTTCELPLDCVLNQIRLNTNCRRCSSSAITVVFLFYLFFFEKLSFFLFYLFQYKFG